MEMPGRMERPEKKVLRETYEKKGRSNSAKPSRRCPPPPPAPTPIPPPLPRRKQKGI